MCPLGDPYTYESGSRVRLGEFESGAGLGLISPHRYERGDPHTHEFGSLEPEPSRTRTCMGPLTRKRNYVIVAILTKIMMSEKFSTTSQYQIL
jgi:hypothetical protein